MVILNKHLNQVCPGMLLIVLEKVIMVQVKRGKFMRYNLRVHFLQLHSIGNEFLFPKGNRESSSSPQAVTVRRCGASVERGVGMKDKTGNRGFPEHQVRPPRPQDGWSTRVSPWGRGLSRGAGLPDAARIVALECNHQDATRGGCTGMREWHLLRSVLARFPAFHSLRKIMTEESFCEEREFGDTVSDGSELQCLPIPRRRSCRGVFGPPSATSCPAEVQLYFS